MDIEIWSDFVCPFCYIGKKRLEAALEDFHGRDQVNIAYKSYQLDPNAENYKGEEYFKNLAQKFGSVTQAKQMTTNIQEQAKTVGLEFDFENAKPTNTFDAHRLNKLAEQENVQTALSEALFRAHFVEGEDVGDTETLLRIAIEVGIEEAKVTEVLKNEGTFYVDVKNDIKEAATFGVNGVPFFIINRKYAVSGAQPVAAFSQALEQVWQEENKQTPLQSLNKSGEACGIDNCDIPEKEA